jgi:hypothetical protein
MAGCRKKINLNRPCKVSFWTMLNWYFSVGSVSDKIVSALTQSVIKCFRVDSVSGEIVSALTRTEIKFVVRWLSVRPDVHVKTVKIWMLAEHRRKFVWCWLSQRIHLFPAGSASDKIVSALTRPAHAKIFVRNQKSYSRFTNIKNQNFEKPARNPSGRTKINVLKIFW